MTIAVNTLGSAALEIDVRGKLREDDYVELAPIAEELIAKEGKIGLLIHLENFRGWSLPALWEDLKFDVKHYRDVSRMALVGAQDANLETRMAILSKPFTDAEIEYYRDEQLAAAREWVQHGSSV